MAKPSNKSQSKSTADPKPTTMVEDLKSQNSKERKKRSKVDDCTHEPGEDTRSPNELVKVTTDDSEEDIQDDPHKKPLKLLNLLNFPLPVSLHQVDNL